MSLLIYFPFIIFHSFSLNDYVTQMIDNGVMIAWTGIEKFNLGISDKIEDQEAVPRWPLGTVLGTSLKDAMKN